MSKNEQAAEQAFYLVKPYIEAAKIKAGSAESNRKKSGSVKWEQVKAIAEDKMPDLNCFTIEKAMSMVAGTARSLGITIEGQKPY